MLITMVLVPMIVAIIGLAITSIRTISSKLEETTLEELLVAAQGLEGYYEYDLVNDNDLVAGNVSDVSTSMGNMNSSADELKGAISFFKE